MTDTHTLERDFATLHDKYLAERDKRLRSDGTAQRSMSPSRTRSSATSRILTPAPGSSGRR